MAKRQQLADALRERLAASGLSQAEFAARLGVSPSVISEALAGRARAGLTPVAKAIVRAYPELFSLVTSIDEPKAEQGEPAQRGSGTDAQRRA